MQSADKVEKDARMDNVCTDLKKCYSDNRGECRKTERRG